MQLSIMDRRTIMHINMQSLLSSYNALLFCVTVNSKVLVLRYNINSYRPYYRMHYRTESYLLLFKLAPTCYWSALKSRVKSLSSTLKTDATDIISLVSDRDRAKTWLEKYDAYWIWTLARATPLLFFKQKSRVYQLSYIMTIPELLTKARK